MLNTLTPLLSTTKMSYSIGTVIALTIGVILFVIILTIVFVKMFGECHRFNKDSRRYGYYYRFNRRVNKIKNVSHRK